MNDVEIDRRIPTGYFWGMFAERRGLKTATLAPVLP